MIKALAIAFAVWTGAMIVWAAVLLYSVRDSGPEAQIVLVVPLGAWVGGLVVLAIIAVLLGLASLIGRRGS